MYARSDTFPSIRSLLSALRGSVLKSQTCTHKHTAHKTYRQSSALKARAQNENHATKGLAQMGNRIWLGSCVEMNYLRENEERKGKG